MSAFGTYLLVEGMISDASDRFIMLGWSLAGTGGLIGIAAGWVRVIVSSERLRKSAIMNKVR